MLGKTFTHYKITELLGRGGMGEVYRAEDLKLGRVVALKFLSPEFVRDPEASVRFVQEARAASALDHPNICTIHGIEETEDGRLFIAMACYEGQTLKDKLANAPLTINEVVDITRQAAQGLAKAHRLGIVHRDIKPANLFLTSDGLVKLLDFGIAKLVGQTQITRPNSLMGTVPYMSPEQVRGEETDRRADLWALGVVLYEMLSGRRPFDGGDPQLVLRAILETAPPSLSEAGSSTPVELESVVEDCLRKPLSERLASADELLVRIQLLGDGHSGAASLDRTANLRGLTEKRDVHPYPGLSSFTEADSEFFHGRSSQVESLWRRLRDGRLLAVAGPSGVGKTSFLQAGLLPTKPESWGVILTKPGASPFIALREALVRELSGDTEAIVALLRENDLDTDVTTVRRWRQGHEEGLLILDQFEELFTLSAPEQQSRFAELLSRLALEADVRVLISLRDDFLFHCQAHPGLAPVMDSLTVLTPLTGHALRRALTQPARDCGYRFEDDLLVEEMIESVDGERGALPLLSFTMASLWERRDREQGLLTRNAYEEIGAVSGALVQHAEAVMQEIGEDGHAIVRELFRNLVTAQGTRTVLDREELVSVFDSAERTSAERVLGQLIDARLLTSYESKGEDGSDHHRVEIVHESLLSAWPRLVRWQTQDVEGAQLRDQLRQAAQLWEQKQRSDDLLWTGTAYREFELWRERYPGGLSDSEESFAGAMAARAVRGRRRKRIVVSGIFVALLMVLAVVGVLWQQSKAESRRGDAARLLMLAENTDLSEDNTLALAMATASLERADTPEARRLALKALTVAPVRQVLIPPDTLVSFTSALLSPDGSYLATVNEDGVLIWPQDGGDPHILSCEEPTETHQTHRLDIHPDGQYIVATRIPDDRPAREAFTKQLISLWSVPDNRHLRTWQTPDVVACYPVVRGVPPQVLATIFEHPGDSPRGIRYTLDSEAHEDLGIVPSNRSGIDSSGKTLVFPEGGAIYVVPLEDMQNTSPTLVGIHESNVVNAVFSNDGDLIASLDEAGTMRVWSARDDGGYRMVFDHYVDSGAVRAIKFSSSNSRFIYISERQGLIDMIDLTLPQARPTRFLPYHFWPGSPSMSPDEQWIVAPWVDERLGGGRELYFYSLAKDRPPQFQAFLEEEGIDRWVNAFLPDGSTLLTRNTWEELWLCRSITRNPDFQSLWRNPGGNFQTCRLSQDGQYICVNAWSNDQTFLVPVDGSEPTVLPKPQGIISGVNVAPDGRRAAVSGGQLYAKGMQDQPIIHVYDLQTGEEQILEAEGECGFYGVWFLPDEQLVSYAHEGLLLWDLKTGEYERLSDRKYNHDAADLDDSGRYLVVKSPGGITLWDFVERKERILPIPIANTNALAISPGAQFVVAGLEGGEVLVFHLDAEEPHLLLGHDSWVSAVWISPEGDEIRSASIDGVIRSWEVPKGKPLHTLPHAELMEILRAQTNMRVIPDVEAEEGYRIFYDRFPGWETTPSW